MYVKNIYVKKSVLILEFHYAILVLIKNRSKDMNDKYDFEDELADSIAQIIDEETAEAESKYGNTRKNIKVKDVSEEPVEDDEYDDEDDEESSISPKAKLAIIISSVVITIGIIVGIAIFFINSTINKSKDNYGYYQNLAYQAKDNDNDFTKAAEYFNKAFKYKDSLLENETVTIDGKEVKSVDILVKDMLNLRDCYAGLNKSEEEVRVLNDILKYDAVNENAIYYLVNIYADSEKYEELHNLYNSVINNKDASEKAIGFFNKYTCKTPVISPAEGEYYKDLEISFIEEDGCRIYYTTDGSDPKSNGSLYTQGINISEGTTNIKYYMTNKYGFSSDVLSAEYVISFEAPSAPKVSPSSGSYETSSEQLIIIGNVPSGADAYYEISFSDTPVKPTVNSTKYTEPFAMPEGSFILSVIIINDKNLESEVVVNNYTLKKVDKFSDTASEQLIWSALVQNKIINDKHKTEDDELLELSYNSKKEINGHNLWLFTVKIADEKQKYLYACDADEGMVYKVEKDEESDEYKLSELKY